jgi:hypothetical protein
MEIAFENSNWKACDKNSIYEYIVVYRDKYKNALRCKTRRIYDTFIHGKYGGRVLDMRK